MIRGFLNLIFIALLVAGLPPDMSAAPQSATALVSKDLVDYVRDARSLGLKDSELRQNAIKAGWKPELIDKALQTVGTEAPAPTDSAKTTETRTDRGVPDQYIIGAGDILGVAVYKETDASVPSVVVRADGKISLPFIKEVEVAGLTLNKTEEIITKLLKPFFQEPDVTVIVREVHSKKIYLVGAVKRGGMVDLKYPMTVLQALTEAGGVTDFAKRKKIYVLRTENGKQYRLPFNYDAVLRGELMEQNVWVVSGDMIVVPQ